ncbi:amino acid adenylation domain-containing protein [Pontiellaceae bacterium B12219]|nr:amino acid adenylation domain-containing protein [Pontiellaceae bacterium B12219]
MEINTVTGWIARGTAGSPDKQALVFGEEALTYSELDTLSNRIANYLISEGVGKGDAVGICLNRSVEMVAALLGILKAGAAYVPLDPAYPAERLAMMADDAQLKAIVVHAANEERLGDIRTKVLIWETSSDAIAAAANAVPKIGIDATAVAYIIFTSGSTGRPKGIEMPHRALANLIDWQLERKTFRTGAKVLQYSSISFDVSFQEIATTLASGGTLYLISDDDRRDPRKLLDLLIAQGIERLFLPYVAMRSMIQTALTQNRVPQQLKEIITAGEQLRVDEVVRRYFSTVEDATLDNQYGPSETHVITAQLLEGNPEQWPDLPSIGTPLKNCSAYIFDEAMQAVPAGEEGELYLAGRNLAHGYVGRADLTKEAFIEVAGHSILYRTGDLAAFNPDGSIEFRGRRDHQIKVLGHRIEPGEINNAASQLPGIGHCLTHAFKSGDGLTRLATYYTLEEGASVSYRELRAHLDSKLPDYMVPAFLIQLDTISYTPSGKVDLKALPEPSISTSQYAGEEIRYETEMEEILSRVWKELLGFDGIPRTADFFELGGDSLRAVTLFLNIQQEFGCDLPLSTLMHAPTIELLAKHIDAGGVEDFPDCRSLKLLKKGAPGIPPLFLVHGGAGNILCFSKLTRQLASDQPVYAFQWSGWDGGRGETGIEEMAQVYCDELLKHFPDTPVRIGGYCIGGYIAIELARLLKKAGVKVLDPLVIFDSPNLRSKTYHAQNPVSEPSAYKRVCEQLAERKICADTVAENSMPAPLPWLKRTGPYALARVWRTHRRLAKYDADALRGETIPVDARNWYCAQTQQAAVKKHKSKGTDMPVLYFRSECQGWEMLLSGWWESLYMGFDEVCHGAFCPHIIGGGHGEILDHPEVVALMMAAFQPLEVSP